MPLLLEAIFPEAGIDPRLQVANHIQILEFVVSFDKIASGQSSYLTLSSWIAATFVSYTRFLLLENTKK